MRREQQRTKGAMEQLQNALGIPKTLHRVEAYDISHIQGFASVGSMVVFEDGKPKHSDYRKFKIKTIVGANDYGAMQEVLTRRLNHAIREKSGGKTQVHAAQEILSAFGMEIPVCGMVKDNKHRTRGLLFQEKEIHIPLTSEGFQLVTRIQDEVHRFAITYHRKLHETQTLHSVLDDIKGIGQVRRKALMRHFGSVEKIAQAEVADLLEVECLTIKAAEAVYAFFHNDCQKS